MCPNDFKNCFKRCRQEVKRKPTEWKKADKGLVSRLHITCNSTIKRQIIQLKRSDQVPHQRRYTHGNEQMKLLSSCH
jgi:hypothetical protein